MAPPHVTRNVAQNTRPSSAFRESLGTRLVLYQDYRADTEQAVAPCLSRVPFALLVLAHCWFWQFLWFSDICSTLETTLVSSSIELLKFPVVSYQDHSCLWYWNLTGKWRTLPNTASNGVCFVDSSYIANVQQIFIPRFTIVLCSRVWFSRSSSPLACGEMMLYSKDLHYLLIHTVTKLAALICLYVCRSCEHCNNFSLCHCSLDSI